MVGVYHGEKELTRKLYAICLEKHKIRQKAYNEIKMQLRCYVKTFLPPLTREEEEEYFSRWKNGDADAKEKLILHNMRLVAHVAKKYVGTEEEMEELISIGTIGLIKAVTSFNQDYGSRFATYAVRCIDNEILMHFRAKRKARGEVSLYETIGTDKEGNQIRLMDVLENEERDVTERVEMRQQIEILNDKMRNVLSPREYVIICKRYGLYGEKELTQREVSKQLGISRSYVSRIEKHALEQLKHLIFQS